MSRKLIAFIIILTLFSFLVRFYRLSEPDRYNFDEVYHVVTAKGYAANNPAAYDPFAPPPEEKTAYDWLHPPLVKLIQAAFIRSLGDEPEFWRLPSTVFGAAVIPAVFILAFILFGPVVAVLSALAIAFENLNLVMSRIAMNDVFLVFFVVVSFVFAVLYGRSGKIKFLVGTSIFLGFAIASKWTGVYAILVICGYVLYLDLKIRKLKVQSSLLVVIPALIYLSSYGQFWLQGHSLKEFVDLHKQIWQYQNRHDLSHPYGTTSVFCVPGGLDGPKTFCPWALDVRPVYFSFEQYGERAGYIYALGNPLVYWFGLGTVIYLAGNFWKEERKSTVALVMAGYFIFWVPWIFSPRILFMYHFLPSTPFLAIAIGYVLSQLWKRSRVLVVVIVAMLAASFFYFYPVTSGFPIKTSDIDNYMWLPSWR
ncbi:MAG: phospholipid carrier-dependent glycosyltransferase [Candidatus Curtissbacteria bacterium]